MAAEPVRALELFAGVGGASLALKAAGVRTIGYCESHPPSRAVLKSNMEAGLLDKAPIYGNIETLTKEDIARTSLGSNTRVDMISAGFPCLGLSVAGRHKGLFGDPRSNLVRHVFRLAAELRPSYIFLENTPAIVSDPNYAGLLDTLRRQGFRCSFMINTASQAGARHRRARWFLLGIRRGSPPLSPAHGGDARLKAFFSQRVDSKVLPLKVHRHWAKHICYSFGNSVVPAQAFVALVDLNDSLSARGDALTVPRRLSSVDRKVPAVAASRSTFVQPLAYRVTPAGCSGGGFDVQPPRPPEGYVTSLRTPALTRPFRSACFPTARTRVPCVMPMPTMSDRSRSDAGNFLLSSKQMYAKGQVPRHELRKKLMVSDQFMAVEFGFPKDWLRRALEKGMK